jgi:hypothetical protein
VVLFEGSKRVWSVPRSVCVEYCACEATVLQQRAVSRLPMAPRQRLVSRYEAMLWVFIVLNAILVPYNSAEEAPYVQILHDSIYEGDRFSTSCVHWRTWLTGRESLRDWCTVFMETLGCVPARVVGSLWRARNWALQRPIPSFFFRLLGSWIEPKLPCLILVRCIIGSISWMSLVLGQRALSNDEARTYSMELLCVQFSVILGASRISPVSLSIAVFSSVQALILKGYAKAGLAVLSFVGTASLIQTGFLQVWFILADLTGSAGGKTFLLGLLSRCSALLIGSLLAFGMLGTTMTPAMRGGFLLQYEPGTLQRILTHAPTRVMLQHLTAHSKAFISRLALVIIAYVLLVKRAPVKAGTAGRMAFPALAYIACTASPSTVFHSAVPVTPLICAAAATILGRLHDFGLTAIESQKLQEAATALNELDLRPYRRVMKEAERKRRVRRLLRFCRLLLVGGAIILQALFLTVSFWNSPGAEAMRALHRAYLLPGDPLRGAACPDPYVHIDAASIQTGASTFLEVPAWKYAWESEPREGASKSLALTHLVTEQVIVAGFERVYASRTFAGLTSFYPFLRFQERIFVHRRVSGYAGANDALEQHLPLPGCWPARLPWN